MLPKIYHYVISKICLPFCQSYKKVVLRLSEHGDAIETQNFSSHSYFTNSVPAFESL